MHYFFKNHLLYSQALIRQTKYIIILTKEGSTNIVNFMTIYKSYSEYVLSSTLSINFTLIDIVLKDYDAAFLYHCWILFTLWWAVDIQIWALLTRNQCKVSDNQENVKACWPLVCNGWTYFPVDPLRVYITKAVWYQVGNMFYLMTPQN